MPWNKISVESHKLQIISDSEKSSETNAHKLSSVDAIYIYIYRDMRLNFLINYIHKYLINSLVLHEPANIYHLLLFSDSPCHILICI